MATQELCILRGEDVENRDVQNNGDSSEESEVEDANNSNWFPKGAIEPKNTHEVKQILLSHQSIERDVKCMLSTSSSSMFVYNLHP